MTGGIFDALSLAWLGCKSSSLLRASEVQGGHELALLTIKTFGHQPRARLPIVHPQDLTAEDLVRQGDLEQYVFFSPSEALEISFALCDVEGSRPCINLSSVDRVQTMFPLFSLSREVTKPQQK